MADIIKAYRQSLPALRFIGRRYGDGDRADGSFGAQWGEWFREGWFDILEKAAGSSLKAIYEDGDAYLGLMRYIEGEPFQYWIGLFAPPQTQAPEGFESLDFPAGEAAVCWVRGPESQVYCQEGACMRRLAQEGIDVHPGRDGALWSFERYGCPRFTTPDEQGRVILDVGFLLDCP